jgi:hypothetical protein
MHVWDSEQPYSIMGDYTQENEWCVLPTRGIVGTIFFYNNVAADHYLYVHT